MDDFVKDTNVPDTNVGDTISRRAVIYLLEHEIELSNRALDFAELVGNEREKFSWGLGLLESIAEDIKQLPFQELVRCQDCMFWKPEPASTAAPLFHRCVYHAFKNYCSMADDFCSKALKKE